MRKLTQREKVLVYIAVVLLLLTGVYYLVKIPSDMKRVRTEAELKIIQLQERESENDLTGKSVLEQEIGREQGVIGENTEDYLPYRTNSMLIPELAEYLDSGFFLEKDGTATTEWQKTAAETTAKFNYDVKTLLV